MSFLSVRGLHHAYTHQTMLRGHSHAVLHDVALDIAAGESLALLGRSGCGKSTLARLLVGLETPAAGDVCFEGTPLAQLDRKRRRDFRRSVQMVFQDALSAVNPRKRVGEIVAEPLRYLFDLDAASTAQRVREALAAVELDTGLLARLPSQLSGGQLQRVCLARALVSEPRLLVLDEAVSSLDLVLQARIIELLRALQQRRRIAFLFITHDLRLVQRFCQRVLVMEQGRIVENAPVGAELAFTSQAGQTLQAAVLPAFPARSRRGAGAA